MAPKLRFQEGRASPAMTWTCRVPNCNITHFGEILSAVLDKGMFIGLEPTSHSMIIQFTTPQTAQGMGRQLASVLRRGGSMDPIVDIEALDLFHAESWGLVLLHEPKLPERLDVLVEPEDESEADESEADEPEADESEADEPETIQMPLAAVPLLAVPSDIFAVALLTPKTIRVPDMVRALSMESAREKDLRIAMEAAGGPLSKALKAILLPRGMDHVKQIQDEARALARPRPPNDILWIGNEPEFITVCVKPKMAMERKVQWIVWKAEKLGLDLTLPTFMGLFKQVAHYSTTTLCLQYFHHAVLIWTGLPLQWKTLDVDVRNLIDNINDGNTECFCKNCKRVLDPNGTSEYCSEDCASQFCRCGEKFDIMMVPDWDRHTIMRNRLGPLGPMMELAGMLRHKSFIEGCPTRMDLGAHYTELSDKRAADKCCNPLIGAVPVFGAAFGMGDRPWCDRCLDEYQRLNAIGRCLDRMRREEINWGHCEEAVRRCQRVKAIPTPTMAEKVCKSCEGRRVRRRLI